MLLILLIAGICLLIASIWDLLTTEVPDEIPYFMVFAGIVYWFVYGVITGEFIGLGYSLLFGTVLLGTGLILYMKGQWGEADAWILAAIGYMIPFIGKQIFMFDYMLNFLIVSSVFTIIYSISLGFLNKQVFPVFMKNIRKWLKIIWIAPLIFIIPIVVFIGMFDIMPFICLGAVVFLVELFWIYAKTIEKKILKREIQTKELKAGDVLEDMKWIGLRGEDVRKIQEQKERVVIKEGLRFVPVFLITFLVTIFYGNIFFMIMGF